MKHIDGILTSTDIDYLRLGVADFAGEAAREGIASSIVFSIVTLSINIAQSIN